MALGWSIAKPLIMNAKISWEHLGDKRYSPNPNQEEFYEEAGES